MPCAPGWGTRQTVADAVCHAAAHAVRYEPLPWAGPATYGEKLRRVYDGNSQIRVVRIFSCCWASPESERQRKHTSDERRCRCQEAAAHMAIWSHQHDRLINNRSYKKVAILWWPLESTKSPAINIHVPFQRTYLNLQVTSRFSHQL